ncbi:MAG: hypothetical protein M1821_006773 [Bathelium mastoideum]|nr:MAG: hypothetical protein M1821_006773 [Bathelium mastoideum]
MNGIPSQHIFTHDGQYNPHHLSEDWFTNAVELEAPILTSERLNLQSVQPRGNESVNYPAYTYGPRMYQSEDSYIMMPSSQLPTHAFEVKGKHQGTSRDSNYSLGNEASRASSGCPRTVPHVDLNPTVLKDSYGPDDAFPPSYYELNAQDSTQSPPIDCSPSPSVVQALQEVFPESLEPPLAELATMNPLNLPSQPQHIPANTGMHAQMMPEFDDEFVASREMTPDNEMKEESYAKRIFRCLFDAPGHTMVLRDIYDWFIQHTDKGKEPDGSGWKNSIRHNLSMNKAFEKVNQPQGDEQKKGCSWKLADFAVQDREVKSTTRYRAKGPNKRSVRSRDPDQKRMEAGAKGGQASRKAAQRRSQRLRETSYLSPSAIRHQAVSAAPPPSIHHVPLLSFDSRAERPASPCFVAHQGPISSGPQQYGHFIPTSSPQNSSLPPLRGSPVPPTNFVSYNHISGIAPPGVPFPSPDEPFFYDSPAESGDEPITPSSMGITRVPDPFWGSHGTVEHHSDPELEYGLIHNNFLA